MAQIEKTMFREYDLRGKVNDAELNEETMQLIGRGFGTYLFRRGVKDVIAGHDFRSYSESLQKALIKGLINTGCRVVDIGMVLTPMLYFAQHHFKIKGGAMVTASHNPNGWSGVKLSDDFSKTLGGSGLQEVYQIISNDDFLQGEGGGKKDSIKEAYFENLFGRIKIAKKLKVVVECGNGTAGAFAPEIIKKAGCEVIPLFCELDASFPHHNPDPETKIAKEALGQKVKETGADLGVSFDGDGDRFGVVDEKGANIWTDRALILLARQVLKERPGAKIVFDVKCTQALPQDIKNHGGTPIMWKTGHTHIKNKMQEENAEFAGERSGHVFFAYNYYGFDDALFAALKFLEYLAVQNQPLSELIAQTPFSDYVISPTIHIFCPDEKKYEVINSLVEEFKKEYGQDRVIDINGARVLFDEGWGLIRASSNIPALVAIFEAKNKEKLEEYKAVFRQKLQQYPKVSYKWENE